MEIVIRKLYLVVGVIATGLGIVGIFVPLMPTTCFALVAAWAFAKSSPAAYERLMNNPHLGPRIRDWQEHRIISCRAKRIASLSIVTSFTFSMFLLKGSLLAQGMLFALMCGLLWFINTRPSKPSVEAQKQKTYRRSSLKPSTRVLG